jgi:hypothetical protein
MRSGHVKWRYAEPFTLAGVVGAAAVVRGNRCVVRRILDFQRKNVRMSATAALS